MTYRDERVSTRRRLTVEDRRAELIAAALELFSTRPAAEVTLDDVAVRAGVSRALAYRYFGGRNEIYVAAMRTAADQMLALLDPPHDEAPLDRLVEAIRRFFDFAEEHATGFQTLLSGHPGAQEGAIGSIVEEVRAALYGRLVEGMGLRRVSAELRLALNAWIATAESAAADWLTHRDLPRRTVEDFLLSQLYSALTVTAARDREVARFMAGIS
jgi:AcrR family transcriptional regulator